MVGHENNLAGAGGEARREAATPQAAQSTVAPDTEKRPPSAQSTALVLERWRLQAGISRQRLSELADVSATYVRTIEAGADDLGRPVVPSPAIMQKLAHGLALALGDEARRGGATPDGASGDAAPLRGASRDQVERAIYAELMAVAGYLTPGAEAGAAAPTSPPVPSAAPVPSHRSVLREASDAAYAECAGTLATVALSDARLLEHARDLLEHWDTVSADDQTLILGVMAFVHDRRARTQAS